MQTAETANVQSVDAKLGFDYRFVGENPDVPDRLNRVISSVFHDVRFEGDTFNLRYHGRPYHGYVIDSHAVTRHEGAIEDVVQGRIEVGIVFPNENESNRRFLRRLEREIQPVIPQDYRVPDGTSFYSPHLDDRFSE